jgi:glycosyltransferase involved in cell wall biosynthesis
MNPNYLISVIVPIYNVEKYIRKCIDSIVGQTYKNLEIFLVDDGSADNCGSICEKYAQKDKRIKVIHKENGGLSSARNAALDVATGDYVMFVDSDDWVEPDFCKRALEMAIREDVSIVSFAYNNVIINEKNNEIKRYGRATNNVRKVTSSEAIKHLILKDDVIFNFAWNKIYKRELFNDVRYPMGMTYEDQGTTYILLYKAKNIFVSNEILYNYVRRVDSISGEWYTPHAVHDRFILWSKRLKDVKIMCPENEKIQIKQLAIEAVEGLVNIKRNSKYGDILKDMQAFLTENRPFLLKDNPSFRLKMYYYARPLLPIIKFSRKTRDFLRRLKGILTD